VIILAAARQTIVTRTDDLDGSAADSLAVGVVDQGWKDMASRCRQRNRDTRTRSFSPFVAAAHDSRVPPVAGP
jgi:hypothetical protein